MTTREGDRVSFTRYVRLPCKLIYETVPTNLGTAEKVHPTLVSHRT